MSDQPTKATELLLLCGKVRDDELTAENAKRLDALLQDSDQAKALYVQYMSVVSLLESRGSAQLDMSGDAQSRDAVDQDVFAELLAFEQQVDAELVHQLGELRSRSQNALPIGGALQWVVRQPAAIGSIAAVLALALVLVVVFRGGPATSPIAVSPETNTNTPAVDRDIATLTAEHDARWAYAKGASLGQALQPGQSLTLTQGFAEITTRSGAVAILEAPATIELLDNDNALQLRSGKLFGICKTTSSKGFLVRTPHMDVTDIGTRFGVQVNEQTSRTHVLEGLVDVLQVSGSVGQQPIRLSAGESAQTSDNSLIRVAFDAELDQYAAALPAAAAAPRVAGDARFSEVVPADLRIGKSEATHAFVYQEQSGVTLDQPLTVTVNEPGQYGHVEALEATLTEATKVTSYLVHFDYPGIADTAKRANAVLTFDQPIVGVIATAKQLNETNALLGHAGVSYPQEPASAHGLENPTELSPHIDGFTISEDRLTLTLDIHTYLDGIDQLRVLVQGDEAQP